MGLRRMGFRQTSTEVHMDKHLKDIIEIEQVLGIIYFSFDGNVLFQYYKQKKPQGIDDKDLSLFTATLDKIQEAELVFENIMLYIVRGCKGFLVTVLRRHAPVAMVRLTCGIFLPELDKQIQKPKGLTRFLKKRI